MDPFLVSSKLTLLITLMDPSLVKHINSVFDRFTNLIHSSPVFFINTVVKTARFRSYRVIFPFIFAVATLNYF